MLRYKSLKSAIPALLLGATLPAPAALANPPVYAPAYGWRAQQQQPYYNGYDRYGRNDGYRVRRANCGSDDVGTVLGAVAGGAIGSNVGQGDNRVIAIITGAVLGGVIGHALEQDTNSNCGYPSQRLGRVGVPFQGYYPNPRQIYPNPYPRQIYTNPYPRQVYTNPYPRQVYVVPANSRPVYVVPKRPQVYGVAPYRDIRRDDRNCRRDERDRNEDGRGHGKHGVRCR